MKRDRIENAIRHIQTAVDIDPWARDLAVEALKAQLSEEDTTSDCISRQAAIDLWEQYHPYIAIKACEYDAKLRRLPSVQPEPSTEIQEILDYLDTTLHPIVSPDNWNVYAELHDMVSMLPSAQPEIVRCRDCKHYYFADNRIPQEQRYTCELDGDRWKPDDYCSFSERRTDGPD